MKSISQLTAATRQQIRYFLTDIDDTMTVSGKLPAASYDGLWRLHDAGIHVIPVTGRPAGWCDLICRQWPVAGVIGENGAFAMYLDSDRLKIIRHPNAPEPQENRERLATIADEVFQAIPGTRWAKDQFSRLYDAAIDFREEPPFLDLSIAGEIRSIFEHHGARAKVSSIHVNAWFGDYDKVSMAERFLSLRFGLDISQPAENHQALFCGDSPNDEPMFARFQHSVAVANIMNFLDQLKDLPTYVTRGTCAEGFAELVDTLLENYSK